jgi:acetolactate decarboxylase
MAVIDPHLVRAVHLSRHRRRDFDEATGDGHDVWQGSSIAALLEGRYEGDLTLGELLVHGDLGLGTVQHLDGELVVVDGECFQVTADGAVHRPPASTRTPFAVVCRFAPAAEEAVTGPVGLAGLTARMDALAPTAEPVVAVRVDGRFTDLHLRSVPRQHPPYPPLTQVVANQTSWTVPEAVGTVVGFRFPDELQGVEVPGYHLHFLAADRAVGGHVTDLTLLEGRMQLDGSHELHVEIPAGLSIDGPDPSAAVGDAIRAVEGRPD